MLVDATIDSNPTTAERSSLWRDRRKTPTSSPRSEHSSARSTETGRKVKRWFNNPPTCSPPSVTVQRLYDMTNSFIGEDHFPSATPKPKPKPLKFPNRIKAAISHNEYCVLGQVQTALINSP
ncbi:hypothetical protein BG015_001093 [Linnemannia schmuckeri]|uniref:Uncharacterized protein n=1 Tax=Linnemannia schmuckeri TaxID=64567 RepID=A0A9P5RQ85_9FUNG|nr:hypothetical protein BG015_001093 [Linnemannia schmuckeri]